MNAFDQNEWFLTITFIAVLSASMLLRPRLPRTHSIMMILLTLYVGKVADTILSLKPYDFYQINDSSIFEFFDFLTWIVYGLFGYILVYFYDYFQPKNFWTFVYIFAWALGSTVFEWISVKMKVFHYNGWQITYSFTFYIIVISFVLLYYNFIKKYYMRMKRQKNVT